MRVAAIMWNFVFKQFLHEDLLISSMEIIGSVVGALCTFGANDLVAFLSGNFVELGMDMAQRAYLDELLDRLFGYLEEAIPRLFKGI